MTTIQAGSGPMPQAFDIPQSHQLAVKISMALGGAVFALLMVFGLLMRLYQGQVIEIGPELFYRVMTAHGIGMVGTAGFTGAAIMWYFLAGHLRLFNWVYWFMVVMFLVGVVFILGSIFLGGFAGAWTFLYPLPAKSGGVWPTGAAAGYIVGVTLVGVGFLVYYLEIGRAVMQRYGSLARGLAWPLLFSGRQDDVPPPTVVVATSVTVFNGLGIVVGAAVLAISLINLYFPEFAIDPLLAKNMIYFFGHVFINASIYMAVIAVYEIIPEYTGRPWKTSRIFALAWTAILLMVMSVYPHHLMQDTVMPGWMLAMGQIVSYASGIPVLVVTAFSLLLNLRHSGIKWDLASSLLTLGVFGWSVGVVPAIIDGVISVNKVMHNTLWVPGHFHMYLLLGLLAMVFGFMSWMTRKSREEGLGGASYIAFVVYLIGGLGFSLGYLIAGSASVPRRWAVHLPEWVGQNLVGSGFAVLSIVGTLIFVGLFLARFGSASKR
jgi:cytochrome c oxidase subunit 1